VESSTSAGIASTKVGGAAHFDQVTRLDDARVAKTGGRDGYTVEIAVPFSQLGLKTPTENTIIKFDWGVIAANRSGRPRDRYAWTDQVGTDLSDLPTEMRLHPGRWGFLKFEGAPKSAMERILEEDSLDRLKTQDIEDVFDSIEEAL
jgi:hypothetical protein